MIPVRRNWLLNRTLALDSEKGLLVGLITRPTTLHKAQIFVSNTLSGFVDNISGALAGNKVSWQDWSNSVLQSLQKILLNAMLVNSIKSMGGSGFLNLFGGGGGGGSTPSGAYNNAASDFKFNAKGGIYNSPSLSAYSGGIYNSPQVFAFAKGAGVFGEAGPEAIMPLTRAANGSLGVRAVAGDAGSPPNASGETIIHQTITQHFTITGNGDAALKQAMNEAAARGCEGRREASQAGTVD
ncbi:tail length tape measure protein [Enterobacter cancerogenus]|uniref:Tail length tape measure protein n=1 Tax=Enterobacter cancerogenus TaxID=69218 RepID=A0A484XAM5_9ENTR|nr:tail length tape measure protein [Enterobacter cancerogenus]